MNRIQFYIDEAQDEALTERVRCAGGTKSMHIREAIERYLALPSAGDEETQLERFKAAVRRIAENPITYLPDGYTYVEDLRKADIQRNEMLERHWNR